MAPKTQQKEFTKLTRHVQLTDADLAALGAVAAQHSIAAALLERFILTLAMLDPVNTAAMITNRLTGFDTRADLAKKLLRLTCANHPLLRDIGLALMSKGKELSTERNIALHWPASRAHGLPTGRNPICGQKRRWTSRKLLVLADAIADWYMDLGQLLGRVIFDGPLASRTTVHGPKTELDPLAWEIFRSFPKGAPLPRRRKS